MSPVGKAVSAAEYTRLTKELSLQELRKARELTQISIAAEFEIAQGDVSKLERRTDMYISTLANYLHVWVPNSRFGLCVPRWARGQNHPVRRGTARPDSMPLQKDRSVLRQGEIRRRAER
jgi:hypothetical protein